MWTVLGLQMGLFVPSFSPTERTSLPVPTAIRLRSQAF